MAISRQNSRSTSRRNAGTPGDFISDRPVKSFIQPAGLPINTSTLKVLRRRLESAQFTSWAFTRRALDSGLVPSMGSIGDCYDCDDPRVAIRSMGGSLQLLARVA